MLRSSYPADRVRSVRKILALEIRGRGRPYILRQRGHAMDTRLRIKWGGSAPGINEHRLSLDGFVTSLDLLLRALRRIASNLLTEAAGDAATGRLHRDAKLLDIEISGVVEGSVGLESVVTLSAPRGMNLDLLENLSLRATHSLFDAIEGEAKGKYINQAVRKYLKSLPDGLTWQEYDFQSNGTQRSVVIGEVNLPEQPLDLPYLRTGVGQVVGVGFEPGEPFVRFSIDDKSITATATDELVERALDLREKSVEAFLVVTDKSTRLLSMRDLEVELDPISQSAEYLLFGKWTGLLERLAQ